MTSSEIRQTFLDFFQSKGHEIVASAPIVLKNDPTLMFTNAGMNQFKDFFLGNKTTTHSRVADTQKCLRVSGKHNDLEEVGVDTYHHTMFEMLGNWSFGDYFKKEAIAWSWELLTSVFEIDKARIYVSVFEGDEKDGLPYDQEAFDEWTKWIAPERILKGNKKDNFWEMGDTGPCGPCTEIHVDCRSDEERKLTDGKTLVNADHPQVIEIWNNVFMQFNRLKDGSLQPLPARHVDTGMGFERLVRVLQQKSSNYDTDVFTSTIAATEKICGRNYDCSDSKEAIAFRVLADHIRAISFTIADGQLPSNTGAGYVIRRILRRAVRYYYSSLDYKQPLLFQLVPVIAAQFENVFPELMQQEAFVTRVIREEEDAFLRTLEKGLKRIEDIIANSNDLVSGKDSFELYDTYGFPADLTRLIATEHHLAVDEAGFETEMAAQKNRSRAATAVETEDWIQVNEDSPVKFVGYDDLNITTQVIKYRKVSAKNKVQYQLVLSNTPFYAESGGQVGDTGTLSFGEGKADLIQVTNTKKENDLIIHFTDSLPTDISLPVKAVVQAEKRLYITYNHTATHLLHAALKQVLGTHVNQKGSLVSPDVLRFDVSHFSKITDEEIRTVERIVNDKIRENLPVIIREMPKDEAMQLGAMALFGEKYGDIVRVVTIDPAFSIELCGGTHLPNTGMIGLFVITSESAVAAGVRRIEALTGAAAMQYIYEKLNQNKAVLELLKTTDPIKTVEKLLADKTTLEKKIDRLEAKELVGIRNELLKKDEIINQLNFIGDLVEVSNPDALKKLCADLKNHLSDFVVVLCANIGGKPFVAISIADNVVAARGLDAGKIIKQHIAPLIKGGGGGQKNLATAGGQDASNLKKVLEVVKGLL
ncbi:MAG TPA: alanine--tRNA ligase [Niabella sp.]|nr:alanine--tRNA ligase [Niabella sp.]HOZ96443.1 alanine--tRNA ligase [Niabella sp.]HQW13377.1 alanine--tRNA ligase [Niabella sp.]HQX18583.1 alanine--tRNA ligase [Niabella sp.]HRB06480.1 alanine--tRNA ligase [Niabella sp.]